MIKLGLWKAARGIPADPAEWDLWLKGGVSPTGKFYVAFAPNYVVGQLMDIMRQLAGDTDYREGNAETAELQKHLVEIVRAALTEQRYEKIRPRVRQICGRIRGNPIFQCLETVDNLYR